jgi:VanZ family protein
MIRLIIWCKPLAKYLLIGWLLTIIIVSSIPSIPTLKIHTAKSEIRLDYMMHFCEYGLLAFMAFLYFVGSNFRLNYKKFILVTISIILFAVIDEFHQKLIPGRSFNVKDILSNIAGILAAVIFSILVFRKITRYIRKNVEI